VVLEKGVCHIPDKLAYGCTALKHVILPDTLKSVGRNAWEYTPFLNNWLENRGEDSGRIFWDGRDLEGDVSLPKGTGIVAGGAFYGNHSLMAVHFPGSVTWVGGAALKGCTSLAHVTWPMAVTTAQPEVFSGCINLETVVSGDDGLETVVSGADGLETEAQSESSPVAAVYWKSIKDRAFFGCLKLSSIFWKDIQEIGKEAFFGCASLIPEKADSLRQVGEGAFEGVGGIGEAAGMSVVGSIIVSGGHCMGEVCVPEGITAIAPFAFSGNRQITKVVFPETLSYIGEGAFFGCSGLTEIRFPTALCAIGARAFEKCTGLQEVCLCADSVGPAAFAYCLS
ncbi:MAG: leucine-rich repeat domain-containing protein, partial [Acetatifactor sp.]|nr:leucine-rich repeat domain-containing protein [Acetatifactor sp.]